MMKQPTQTPRSTFNHVLWAITLASVGLVASVCSQTADAFNPGASGSIYALAVQMDGRILVGGDFYMLGGQVRNRLGRLNPDGSLDPDLNPNPGALARVSCLAVQADGKIVVGGSFTKLCGQARNNIGRLNADGSLDISFNPNANGEVCALAVQTDGKIIVGGRFYMLGGEIHDYIGRLNPDGSVDPSFNSGAGRSYPYAPSPYVYSLAVQPDGQILVGGMFTKLDGEPRNCMGRLYPDGTLDTSFNPGAWAADPNAAVSSLAVQADGKILVGGSFTNLCSQARKYIGRLNADGSLDTGFNPGANGYLYSLVLQADGKILAGGTFTTLGGQTRNRIGRLNANGSLDTSFNSGVSGSGNYWAVYSLAVQGDGRILVGGNFTTPGGTLLGGQPRNYIGRLYNTAPATQSLTYDGSTLTWLRGDTSPEVSRTAFEGSTDGLDWISLGAGERISGGWQLTGLSWPTNATVRACGSAVGGYQNASEGVVHTGLGPPGSITQPISRTNHAATVACFSALAVGTEPLSYQWRKGETDLSDGGNVFGAATPTLMLTNVLGGDAGAYSVVVTNSCGGLTSSVATLTVVDPLLTNQPASQSTTPGQSIVLSVAVVGTPPLTYQWRKEGVSLTGATASSLSWTNVQGSDAGSYDVVVTNRYGSATSAVAVLTVNLATWDNSFSASSGGSSGYYVHTLALQADGKILAGGSFTTLGGQPRYGLGRLNANGSLDASFNPDAKGSVYGLALQADGKLLVGGSFTTLGGQPRSYLGRLNADGSLDTTFDPEADYNVNCLAGRVDGRGSLGGGFTTLGGQTRNRLGRLNTDGSLDLSFNPGAGSWVNCLAVQPDGQILVGGEFTTLGGQARNYIGRLDANGNLDTSFDPGAGGNSNPYVGVVVVQADGRILLGGRFGTLGGQSRTNLGRLNPDGSVDLSFNASVGDWVKSFAIQADGKILVGGDFVMLAGQVRYSLGRLNGDGSLDTNFDPTGHGGVGCVILQADGRILVGGGLWELAGQPCYNLARLHNTTPATQSLTYDGSNLTWLRGGASPEVWRTTFEYSTNGADWLNLGVGTRISGGWQLAGVSVASNLNLRGRGYLTGGNRSSWLLETIIGPLALVSPPLSRTNNAETVVTFSVAAGGTEPLGYRWRKGAVNLNDGGNVSGASTPILTLSNVFGADAGGYSVVITNVYGSLTSAVATLTVVDPVITSQPVSQSTDSGQSVILSVTAVGTAPLSYQWRQDGVPRAGATASTLTLTNLQGADAGRYDVVVANQFGSATSAVALLTVNVASVDTSFNPDPDGEVFALAVQADSQIVMGGRFASLGGQVRYCLGRLYANGTLDSSFNPGAAFEYEVDCLAVQADGKILVGGRFTTLGGQPRNYLGRLNTNGSLDTSFDPGADFWVNCLVVQADGKILVGGGFTTLAGQPRNCLGRLNANGSLDTGFNSAADASVCSLVVQPDGKIVVGGAFTSLCGQPRNYLGRLNGDGSLDLTFNPGAWEYPYPSVYCLALEADGKILVGGYFTKLGGQPCNYLGRLNADGSLDTSFDMGADGAVSSLVVQADGKILVGSGFTTRGGHSCTNIGRLNPDGSLDTTFDPGADGNVSSLAVQADGKILVGGSFTALGRVTRNCFGRLNNTAAATQSLSCYGSNLTWLRGGTGPEVWRTAFEYSTNGVNWFALGAGNRISGGWQLTGVSLPANATVRARGSVSGGYYNGSSWFVESTLQLASQRPILLTSDGSFGFQTNRFGFNVQALARQAVVIEASTNLVSWMPIHTNLADDLGLFLFRDSQSELTPQRFYRVRVE